MIEENKNEIEDIMEWTDDEDKQDFIDDVINVEVEILNENIDE